METTVLFFASLGDLVGHQEVSVDLKQPLKVAELVKLLEEQYPALKRFDRRFRVAVDQSFVEDESLVEPGREVALIPPVSGGAGPVVRAAIKVEPLDMAALTEEVLSHQCGAVVTFLGTVRDLTGDQVTDKLQYSSYEKMAQSELLKICEEAAQKWPLGGAVVEHRVGELMPGDIAVVAACSAPHREEAFQACRFLIDTTKERVPLWKKEFGPDGTAWIEGDARVQV